MILRDIYCPECGVITENVEFQRIGTAFYRRQCECGFFGDHAIVCNGGLKSRWRFADFPQDPDFYKGQVSVGDVMIDDEVVSKADDPKRLDKLDRLRFDGRKKRGKETLVFDQKE